jgi:membrane-associated phospholipid phosphatase
VSAHIYAQQSINNIAEKIYSGVSESVGWQDIPVGIYMINQGSVFVKDNTKLITLPAFGFDRSFQGSIGRSGRASVGGMDQNTLPGIVLYSRAAYTIARDIISPESVTKDDYKKLFLFYKTITYTHVLTEAAKNLIDRQRPDRSDSRSFFSGHTAVTFAAANFLYREINDYIDSRPDYSENTLEYTGIKTASFAVLYGWAGYVGYSRMHDNKHYLSDVLLGAAAGFVISNLIYNDYLNSDNSLLNYFSLGISGHNPSVSLNLSF